MENYDKKHKKMNKMRNYIRQKKTINLWNVVDSGTTVCICKQSFIMNKFHL